ncbi:MAG: DegQ family serine endoprotease [Pseudomonadota bacterium]|nr:DegQ family serine endoprotease [Pseudomonadota bacterium]
MRTRSKTAVLTILAAPVVGVLLYFGRAPLMHSFNSTQAATVTPALGSIAAPDSYADIVDRVAPAVVTIRSAKRSRAPQQYPFLDDPFFRQFFGAPNSLRPRENPAVVQQALGSGVIVSADGHILTNHHVIDGADEISVELNDRRTLKAKVIGSDAPSDLALLKIDASGLPVLPLGDSDKVRVGDICLAVGNPLGIGETVTSGIVSARGRATGLSDGNFQDFLQTDAAINQGNSGGALVNTHGQLIGINSQILSTSGGNIGIGFAIPSNMARNVMQQLEHGGKVRRGKLGIGIQAITSELAKSLGLADIHGVLVNSVETGGPADRAGIRAGDVITAINGQRVDDPNALRNAIANVAPGTEVGLAVVTAGKARQVQAHLTELDQASGDVVGDPAAQGARLGVSVGPLNPETATRLGLPRGTRGVIVVSVDPRGAAARAGVQPNDVILAVNQQSITSAAELTAALRKSASPVLLLLNREGQNIFLAIGLP